MAQPPKSFVERRQFGRRQTNVHGWIVLDGKRRLPCIVRNVSEGGALLELDVPKSLPFWFNLVVECKGFEARCEIRHSNETSLGVRFVRVETAGTPIDAWTEANNAWHGVGDAARPPERTERFDVRRDVKTFVTRR
jgi:hypothetical protein